MRIQHPEWLQVEVDNKRLYGYDQDWYATAFKRTRGCGPTAAAMLLAYANRREARIMPYQDDNIGEITCIMNDVWKYVTPGRFLGLNSTDKFYDGVTALLEAYGLTWHCRQMRVPILKPLRTSLEKVIAFVKKGLAADCPVAFLNLHKGRASELTSWHWIVLVALDYDANRECYLATCYDGGKMITFNIGEWLATSNLGGGFCYLTSDGLGHN